MAGTVSSCLRSARDGASEELVQRPDDANPGGLNLVPRGDEKLAISQVRDYLFVSGASQLTPSRLRPLGITAVINCLKGLHQPFDDDITYLYIPVDDVESQDMLGFLPSAHGLIEQERKRGGRVLVYCGLGISRSATVAISYLMANEEIPLVDAYRAVQSVRSCVCPNVGFFRQMIGLEEERFGKASVSIISPAPGIHVPDVVWSELYEEVMARLKNQKI